MAKEDKHLKDSYQKATVDNRDEGMYLWVSIRSINSVLEIFVASAGFFFTFSFIINFP